MISEFLLSQVISLFDPSNYKPNTYPVAPKMPASAASAASGVIPTPTQQPKIKEEKLP